MNKHLSYIFFILIYISSNAQQSKIEHYTFFSKSLEEERKITLYFPENFKPENRYNAVFCTDGQMINEYYKNKLDSVFASKSVNPFVMIGVNSNEELLPNSYIGYRQFEYIENEPSDNPDLKSRFERHLKFFVYEVDEYLTEELNWQISNKYFYGVSNGAGFGVTLSTYYPELFSKYILYSMGGENYKKLKWDPKKYPFFIIRCGNEKLVPFIDCSKKLSKYLSRKHYEHIFEIYNGGHNREDWLNLFIADIKNL